MADPIRVVIAAGARPNFMKVAPLMLALGSRPDVFETVLVHTGQHYDAGMSDVFFEDLQMGSPDEYLNVGSGTHAEQTAAVLVAFEKVLAAAPPDIVLVAGDVNSTLACALATRKLNVPVGHVEAGLRSRNWAMPEEVNRVVTDILSDYLFTPSPDANENLEAEGISSDRVHLVGNIMIDSLARALPEAEKRQACSSVGLEPKTYGLITLHRPSNIDEDAQLKEILTSIGDAMPAAVFPVHPRTRKRITALEADGFSVAGTIKLLEPLGYYDFLSLMMDASFVLTDSGGIQEETTYLGVPCMTLREETERPITVGEGTNELVTLERLPDAVASVIKGDWKRGTIPDLWDGKTADRIVQILEKGIVPKLRGSG
ncbi:MAG TPA: UDP-N-acetylglucosamine 2-epimerase (non-hydrolyzing) [Actinomycetota bacterium]|nr:UDP-N-acetylglucosamine 2-epimerase (non-hydrolyzing) [Actinomycetota bacterium]